MKLASFSYQGVNWIGVEFDDKSLVIIDDLFSAAFEDITPPEDMKALLQQGDAGMELVAKALAFAKAYPHKVNLIPQNEVNWCAPAPNPSKVCSVVMNNSASNDRKNPCARSLSSKIAFVLMYTIRNLLGTCLAAIAFWSIPVNADSTVWKTKKVEIRGLQMAYHQTGEGNPIVMLHGNPTSSYHWREVIPHIKHLGRVIAPDMLGMGDSDPLPDSGPGKYTYARNRDFMFELFEELGLDDDVILIVHDWGSAIGFDWAYQNSEKVKGIAFFEAIVRPPEHVIPDTTGGMFQKLRSPAGDKLILEQNMMLERRYIDRLGYYLSEEDKAEARRRYLEPGESRRPILAWTRQLPLGGTPEDNDAIFKEYSEWLQDTEIPKLFFRGEPGALIANNVLLDFVRTFKNQKEVKVYGGHHLQDTSPDAIGRALAEWITNLD